MKINSPLSRLDQYRLALLPTVPHTEAVACRDALVEGGPAFLDFVLLQELGPLWHHRLQADGLLDSLPPATLDALRATRMSATAGYLAQRAELERIDRLFGNQGILYLVLKGVFVRECVYTDPTLRPACDIDLLVSPQDRRRAALVLLDAGYTVDVKPKNICHQATFNLGLVDIDFHWHAIRPWRTRIVMTDDFLARRQRVNGFWGLSDSDTLFLMLTHPAFAKYVCSPGMGLSRVADFMLWIQQRKLDWPTVLQLLEMQGLKTAAWIMLSWFRMLAQSEAEKQIDEWLDSLQPGKLRMAYLRIWLSYDLPSRWLDRPILIQLGLTLFLHDRLTDVLHGLRGYWQARQNRLLNTRLLLGDEYRLNNDKL